jgi:hypothetical protein
MMHGTVLCDVRVLAQLLEFVLVTDAHIVLPLRIGLHGIAPSLSGFERLFSRPVKRSRIVAAAFLT